MHPELKKIPVGQNAYGIKIIVCGPKKMQKKKCRKKNVTIRKEVKKKKVPGKINNTPTPDKR